MLRYLSFNILRSFSIGGRLCFEYFWCGHMSLSLKFEENPISGCWDIQLLIFCGRLPLEGVFNWRLSLFQAFLILVWSHKLKFEIWGKSDQWLPSYSTFNILRSSSIRGSLQLEVVFVSIIFDFGLVEVKFKIWRKSDQWFLRYSTFNIWALLPLFVVFHWKSSLFKCFKNITLMK